MSNISDNISGSNYLTEASVTSLAQVLENYIEPADMLAQVLSELMEAIDGAMEADLVFCTQEAAATLDAANKIILASIFNLANTKLRKQRAEGDTQLRCYQCDKEVLWLAPDSRCKDCTRYTPEELIGE